MDGAPKIDSSCFLCGNLADRGGAIWEGGGFRLLSDLSPLSRSHLLLATVGHFGSFLRLANTSRDESEVFDIFSTLSQLKRSRWIFVEHGEGSTGSFVGNRIHHAHVHCFGQLPIEINALALANLLAASVGKKVLHGKSIRPFLRHSNEEYFWIHDPYDTNNFFLSAPGVAGRQLLRQCMCRLLERPFKRYEEEERPKQASEMTYRYRPLTAQIGNEQRNQ